MTKEYSFTGVIKRIKFHNPLNGYGIISVEIFDNKDLKDNVTVTVNQPEMFEGVTMKFKGCWIKHPKFGKQFKASFCQEVPPATTEAVIKYLSSGFFPGIGPVTAKKIVKYFKDDALDVFRNNIDRLTEVPGINRNKLKVLRESWKNNQEMNSIMLFLQEHMISTVFSVKIYKEYGINSIPILKKNPYKLASDISGAGFIMADKLAMSLGFKKDGEERISSAIHHILSNNHSDGHCYLTKGQIKTRIYKLINIESKQKINEILDKEELEENIVCVPVSKSDGLEKRYYSRDVFYDEKYVAEKVIRLSKKIYANNKEELKERLNSMLQVSDIKLSEEQSDSVIGVLSNGLSVLTGGPGVGKTTTVKYVYDMLVSMGKEVLLAAPTGRAAQRMSEVIGSQSKTIHRLLKWDAGNGNFRKSEKDMLDCDFIILDECSMIDIRLASSFFRAISPSTQILLVGDKDQLPSVGIGNLMSDLIQSDCIQIYNLQKVFRQAEKSKIITYAHQINKGETPNIDTPIQSPSIWKNNTDCMFIDSSMKEGLSSMSDFSTFRYGMNALDMIVKLYKDTIKKYMGDKCEIQILTPMNKGSIGTKEINKKIQEEVNPESKNKKEIKIGEKIYREGDRVIQTSNNYDLNVFNGDIGYIKKINSKDSSLIVDYGNSNNSKLVQYERQNAIEIELAYSISIHKSQGSEFQVVIMPVLSEHNIMLYRNLIYTGITRARKMAVLIGEREAFQRSVENINPNSRQTSLKIFLKEHYEDIEAELEFLN
jgi:exodeoxyribonuclease V alpha subunit